MADEKLVFQIGFDLDSAVKDATSEWKRVQRELEAAINARPISISMDTRGLERFNTFVERTYASLEDLQDLFPEVFKETKDGEGITKRFQAMETSINAVSKEMRNLEKVWNNLSQAEKFDDDGNLTERAQELKRAYVELYQSQKTQGQTLQEITKEAINLANQEYEAQQRKKKQEEDFIRLLNLEETTLEKLQAKQGAWKQKLSQTEIGTSDWSNAIAEVQRLETKIKDLQKQIKGVATETKKTSKTKVDIDTSTFAGKLKDLENRWKALNAEQRKGAEGQALRAEWRKLSEEAGRYTSTLRSAVSAEDRLANAKKKTTQATHEQNAAYKTQSGYLSRLFQRMVAYASVAQAFSFVRNIRDVTAEFELQRVALGSIIGDLNEANKMFEQIKAAAVKSPFQIKELVSYTKQLAAYKIETDDLFETTQRLADISAGLGVGMERLVLAYGQIRATGYLRASEVRQLTEAGIPIVEELAKKMSQLRGETVSAAEVMQLISERAISFGMVKEVFDDMTSAGGMFYKMQEKQAETLAGQWSNLKDSIAIMYEEIGNTEGVNNSIKGTIGLVKSLAENWQVVSSVSGAIAVNMGLMKLASLFIPTLVVNTKKVASAEEQLRLTTERRIAAQQRGGRIGIWVAKSQEASATATLNAARATTKFGRAWATLVGMFKGGGWIGIAITAVTALVSWLISARQEANRLNKELEKIGSEGNLQADQSVRNFERLAIAIRESADGSARQTDALKEMKRTYGEFLPTQDKSIINLVREKDGYNAVTQAIREKIALQIQEQKLNTIASEYGSRITKKETKLKDWLTGEDWRSVDKFSQEEATRITNAIRQAVSDGLISAGKDWEENAHTINKIIREQTGVWGRVDVMYGIERQRYEEFIDILYDMNDQVQQVEWSMESATGSLGKYTQAYKDFKEKLKDVTGMGEKFSFEWNVSKTKSEIKAYNEFIGDLLAKEGIKFDIGNAIDFKGLYEALGDNYPQLKQVVAKIQGEYEKLVPKDLEKLIKEQFSTLATKYGASLDKLQHYFKSADQSTQDWVKTLKDAKTELGNQIFDAKKLDKDTTALEAQKQVIEAMITAWDNSEKTQKSAAKSSMQLLKDEIATTEKMYKRYKELRKYMSESDAKSAIEKEFASVNLPKKLSVDDMLSYYQTLLDKAQKMGDKDLVLEIQTKIGDFRFREFQEKIKSNLQLLKDEIAQSKEAKQFYDKIFGLSGNKDLAMSVTLSVYGTTGDDLAQKTAEQLRNAFGKIDISSAINPNTFAIDWSVVRKLFEDNYGQMSEESRKVVQEMISNEQQLSKARIESWAKDLESVKSYADKRIALAEYTAKRISEIESSNVDDDKKQELIKEYRKRESKEAAKLQFDAFKDESLSNIFSNLENTSSSMLKNLRDNLVKFKSQLTDITEIKEVEESIQRIDDQLATRNPFKTIAESIATMKSLGSQSELEDALSSALEKRDNAQRQFNLHLAQQIQYEEEYQSLLSQFGKDDARVKKAKQLVDLSKTNVGSSKQGLDNANQEVKVAEKKRKELSESQQKLIKSMQEVAQISGVVNQSVSQIYNAFGNLMGDEIDAEFFNSIAGGLNDTAQGVANLVIGIKMGDPVSIISGIGQAIQGISSLAVAGKIKRANREIARQQRTIENLEYAYQRLEKAQESALGGAYVQNYKTQLKNLEAQQTAYLKQADAERSKGKKSDSDKIKEYEQQARDTADKIKDMQGELQEYFLGTDLTSAAQDFANAWIDAYKEFGSTTDAMRKKFDDMIQNMIVKSIAGNLMKNLLRPVFETIDDKLAKKDSLSVKDIDEIADKVPGIIANMNKSMTQLVDNLAKSGYDIRNTGGELKGISREIATASEESILGLAAGINTQNYYISYVPMIHSEVQIIRSLLQGGAQVQQGGFDMQSLITIQNQHLSHLPNIAANTAETVARCERAAMACERVADNLDRVIKPRGVQSTHVVNTSL